MKIPPLLLIAIFLSVQQVNGEPAIQGNAKPSECRPALQAAMAAFHSSEHGLQPPIDAAPVLSTSIVLSAGGQRSAFDTKIDELVFQRITPNMRPPTVVHWQRAARKGSRLVLVSFNVGWHGDRHLFYSIDADLSVEQFLQIYTAAARLKSSSLSADAPKLVPLLGRARSAPPLILETEENGEFLIIDTDRIGTLVPTWRVHKITSEGFTELCRIVFAQDPVGIDRLPSVVRKLARHLDEAIGPGKNEGTFQSTARLRLRVRRDWFNLSTRPWALTEAPYNTREEIDDSLKQWAVKNRARQKLRKQIVVTYGLAKLALADFYAERFALTEQQAEAFSEFAVDYILRRHFVFPSTRNVKVEPSKTPWPSDVR